MAWKLIVDESMNWEGSGIEIVLENPRHEKILRAFKLDFLVSNNEVEYEALLTRLKMARDLDIKAIHIFCDSKLVSAQVNTEFQALEPRMAVYLQAAKDWISSFESFKIMHIPKVDNSKVNRLAQIGSGINRDQRCPVEALLSSLVYESLVNSIEEKDTWMTPIVKYLENGVLPPNKIEVRA